MAKMYKVIVYLSLDYQKQETIYLSKKLNKFEIHKEVNKRFDRWYFYDIFD